MKNEQLIALAKMEHKVKEEAHTFEAWKQLGYVVKKGEKAKFSTEIWKRVTSKDKETEEENTRFILKKAHFFTQSQVELLKKK